MTPQQRKLLIPLIVIGASLGIALLYMVNPDRTSRDRDQQETQESAQQHTQDTSASDEDNESQEPAVEGEEGDAADQPADTAPPQHRTAAG